MAVQVIAINLALALDAELPQLDRLPLKYLRELIVDACVAGKPPTEAGIEAALRRHVAEQQAQTTCCGRCCGCTCGWA